MDWIKEYENNQLKMQKKCGKEYPTHIDLFFYYIDDNTVRKLKKQRWKYDKNEITSEQLLFIIQKRKIHPYVLDEILLYDSTNTAGEIKPIPLTLTDIELKPSLFIFNEINSIFFFFYKRKSKINNNTKYNRELINNSTRRQYKNVDFLSPIEVIEKMYITKNWKIPEIIFSIKKSKLDELFTQCLMNFMKKRINIDTNEFNLLITHIKKNIP